MADEGLQYLGLRSKITNFEQVDIFIIMPI